MATCCFDKIQENCESIKHSIKQAKDAIMLNSASLTIPPIVLPDSGSAEFPSDFILHSNFSPIIRMKRIMILFPLSETCSNLVSSAVPVGNYGVPDDYELNFPLKKGSATNASIQCFIQNENKPVINIITLDFANDTYSCQNNKFDPYY